MLTCNLTKLLKKETYIFDNIRFFSKYLRMRNFENVLKYIKYDALKYKVIRIVCYNK